MSKTRSIYLPPAAVAEITDPTPLDGADLVDAVRLHIEAHIRTNGESAAEANRWAATVTAVEIAQACERRGLDGSYMEPLYRLLDADQG